MPSQSKSVDTQYSSRSCTIALHGLNVFSKSSECGISHAKARGWSVVFIGTFFRVRLRLDIVRWSCRYRERLRSARLPPTSEVSLHGADRPALAVFEEVEDENNSPQHVRASQTEIHALTFQRSLRRLLHTAFETSPRRLLYSSRRHISFTDLNRQCERVNVMPK